MNKEIKPWVGTYNRIRNRCNYKPHTSYKNYGGRGIKCEIGIKELKFLWYRDSAFNMKKPSIDRIDNNGNYTLENCRYLEFSENRIRANSKHSKEAIENMRKASKRKRPVSMFKDGTLIRKFQSLSEASRETGNDVSTIWGALSGRYNHCGGYQWEYTKEAGE